MSDDSFFREVSEELRQDKVKAVWTKFGAWLFAAVVLAVAVTVGVVGWERYQTAQANASGDAYLAALDLAREGKRDEAVAALEVIAADGYGAYPDLARMSIGGVLHEQDKPDEAVAGFDRVTNDSDAPQPIRDMAAVRAAYILVDSGTLDEVRNRVERLTGDSEPLRFPAREAIALAAWKAGDRETGRKLFQQLLDDSDTPSGIAGRAKMMLEVIAAGDPAEAPTAATGAAATPPSDPAEAPSANGSEAPVASNGAGTTVMPTTAPAIAPTTPESGAEDASSSGTSSEAPEPSNAEVRAPSGENSQPDAPSPASSPATSAPEPSTGAN